MDGVVKTNAWVAALLGGIAVTQTVMMLGQMLSLRWVDPAHNSDPIEAVGHFGVLLKWVVYPVAALCGGLFVGLTRRTLHGGVVSALATPLPLWMAWAQPGLP